MGGGGCNHHPSSENCVFSATVHPVDLRQVCKLKFVRCGPKEKNRVLYSSRLNRGGPTKFKNSFFQIANLRFSTFLPIFDKIFEFSKTLRGRV